jgi:hypothetical protein
MGTLHMNVTRNLCNHEHVMKWMLAGQITVAYSTHNNIHPTVNGGFNRTDISTYGTSARTLLLLSDTVSIKY